MAIPGVPSQNTGQGTITLDHVTSAYSALWWTSQTIAQIPSESVGWLVGQGWGILGIQYAETDVLFQFPLYSMGRQSLQNWQILQSLLNSWTIAYNEARDINSFRYNQVVTNWAEMLATSHTHFDAETTEHNAHATVYISNLTSYMNEVEVLVKANQAELDTAIATASGFLTTASTDYSTFSVDYASKVVLFDSDYAMHLATATGFLTGLGATELARINEKFDSTLGVQLQQLVDKGMYTGALAVDTTARNTRDRNEEIAALNDKLAREKLANEHTLYGQLVGVRKQTLEAKERLYSLGQELLHYRLATTMGNAQAIVQHRHKVIAQLMTINVARLEGLDKTHQDGMKLMAYQLDERNKIIVGLYGFVERRTDVGPSIEDLAKICTSLGDSGGGWLTP
jgi:hypothetical protein